MDIYRERGGRSGVPRLVSNRRDEGWARGQPSYSSHLYVARNLTFGLLTCEAGEEESRAVLARKVLLTALCVPPIRTERSSTAPELDIRCAGTARKRTFHFLPKPAACSAVSWMHRATAERMRASGSIVSKEDDPRGEEGQKEARKPSRQLRRLAFSRRGATRTLQAQQSCDRAATRRCKFKVREHRQRLAVGFEAEEARRHALVTLSLSAAGCMPVCKTIRAAPCIAGGQSTSQQEAVAYGRDEEASDGTHSVQPARVPRFAANPS